MPKPEQDARIRRIQRRVERAIRKALDCDETSARIAFYLMLPDVVDARPGKEPGVVEVTFAPVSHHITLNISLEAGQ